MWYVIRAETSGQIILQVGIKQWQLSNMTDVKLYLKGKHRVFSMVYDDELIEIEYKSPADGLYAKSDVTYDGLDEYLDDFFVYLLDLWKDKDGQSRMVKCWMQGVIPIFSPKTLSGKKKNE